MNLARSDIIKMGGNAPRMRMGVQLYLVVEQLGGVGGREKGSESLCQNITNWEDE